MVVVIDPHSGVPVFRQLRDQIRFQIVSGMLEPGEELPSTRALSAELGLNPMTISKAYTRLEIEGLVEKRPGLPLVVSELPDDEVDTQRMAQFRERARPAAAAARQLGLTREQALRVFEEMLNGIGKERG
ncbi:MAG: GntR family transcriptional regulator [Acidobacteriota bacterium]|jgi:GntR family transcriptional regulator